LLHEDRSRDRSDKRTGQGTGQIRGKVKRDEIGIGITDAGSLSLKAGEGAGVYTTKYKRVVEKTRLLRYLTCPYSTTGALKNSQLTCGEAHGI
jgi:hypothetical protein